MNKPHISVLTLALSFSAFGVNSEELSYEAELNTANTIRAAFELRKLAESLAPGVDTRCYIAKLAEFQAASLPQSAKVIADHPSGNKESDEFAIQSVNVTMEIYKNNQIQRIANVCKKNS